LEKQFTDTHSEMVLTIYHYWERQTPFQSPGFCVKGHQPGSCAKIAFAEIANPTYVTNNMIAFMTRAGIKLVAASQANTLPNPSVLHASNIPCPFFPSLVCLQDYSHGNNGVAYRLDTYELIQHGEKDHQSGIGRDKIRPGMPHKQLVVFSYGRSREHYKAQTEEQYIYGWDHHDFSGNF
jgi:hypothetical protein